MIFSFEIYYTNEFIFYKKIKKKMDYFIVLIAEKTTAKICITMDGSQGN